MIALWYFPLFLGLGLVVSYEDWREKKIRNHWIALGVFACALGLGLCWLNTILGYAKIRALDLGEFYLPWSYYPKVLAHGGLTLVSAVALWRMGIWPAGDAKLFAVLGWLIVLIEPNLPGFPKLLFLMLLLNTFVPPALFFLGELVVRWLAAVPAAARVPWGRWARAVVDRFRVRLREAWPYRWEYAALGVNLFAAFFAIRLVYRRLQAPAPDPFLVLGLYFAMSFFWERLSRLLRRRRLSALLLSGLAGAACAAAASGVDVGRVAADGLRMTFSFGLFLSLTRAVVCALLERQSIGPLDSSTVSAGTLLSQDTWARLQQEPGLDEVLKERYPDGLTAPEAAAVRAWLDRPGAALAWTPGVYAAIPFAVWVFAGAALTLCRPGLVAERALPAFREAASVFAQLAARWGP